MNDKKVVCHDIHKNLYEVDADQLTFRPSVYGILIENDKILLSRQHGKYDVPGGGVELYETLEEGVIREFQEETGLLVEIIKPVHVTTSFFHPAHAPRVSNEYWNCPIIIFTVRKISGELSIENFDKEEKNYASMAQWIDVDKITKEMFVNPLHYQVIKALK